PSGPGSQTLERPRPLMAETTKITRQAPTIEATTPQIENASGIAPPSPLVKNETIQPTTKAPTTPDTMFAISPIWAFLPMIMEANQPASPPPIIQAMMVPIVGVLSRSIGSDPGWAATPSEHIDGPYASTRALMPPIVALSLPE